MIYHRPLARLYVAGTHIVIGGRVFALLGVAVLVTVKDKLSVRYVV